MYLTTEDKVNDILFVIERIERETTKCVLDAVLYSVCGNRNQKVVSVGTQHTFEDVAWHLVFVPLEVKNGLSGTTRYYIKKKNGDLFMVPIHVFTDEEDGMDGVSVGEREQIPFSDYWFERLLDSVHQDIPLDYRVW